MWPGQQPPGGENPQDQNPYQQPGYQQPNPYQQPGYQQQPNPYQQPTVPQYGAPMQPPGGPTPPDDKKKTTIVAIVAATAVVAAAVITGVVVLGDDDSTSDDSKPTASKTPTVKQPTGDPAASPTENPRGGDGGKPTIAGWKVVSNPKHGTQFDVPAGWEVAGSGVSTGFEDDKKGDGSPVVAMSAPAHYKSKWCTFDTDKDGKLGGLGPEHGGHQGRQGSEGRRDGRVQRGRQLGLGRLRADRAQGHGEGDQGRRLHDEVGLAGSVSTATAIGVKKENKCETDGKSIAFSFKDPAGEFKSWVLYANKGVPDELPDATIKQILSTVRLAATPTP